MQLKREVFPAPLGPITEWMVPSPTSRSTSFRAWMPPNLLDRVDTSSSADIFQFSPADSDGCVGGMLRAPLATSLPKMGFARHNTPTRPAGKNTDTRTMTTPNMI